MEAHSSYKLLSAQMLRVVIVRIFVEDGDDSANSYYWTPFHTMSELNDCDRNFQPEKFAPKETRVGYLR
jgi:hypothetical protein